MGTHRQGAGSPWTTWSRWRQPGGSPTAALPSKATLHPQGRKEPPRRSKAQPRYLTVHEDWERRPEADAAARYLKGDSAANALVSWLHGGRPRHRPASSGRGNGLPRRGRGQGARQRPEHRHGALRGRGRRLGKAKQNAAAWVRLLRAEHGIPGAGGCSTTTGTARTAPDDPEHARRLGGFPGEGCAGAPAADLATPTWRRWPVWGS